EIGGSTAEPPMRTIPTDEPSASRFVGRDVLDEEVRIFVDFPGDRGSHSSGEPFLGTFREEDRMTRVDAPPVVPRIRPHQPPTAPPGALPPWLALIFLALDRVHDDGGNRSVPAHPARRAGQEHVERRLAGQRQGEGTQERAFTETVVAVDDDPPMRVGPAG